MPKWLTSNYGRLWTLNRGRRFYITEWVHGRKSEILEDFEKLGRTLASLHTTSRFHPSVAARVRRSPSVRPNGTQMDYFIISVANKCANLADIRIGPLVSVKNSAVTYGKVLRAVCNSKLLGHPLWGWPF